MSPSELNLLKAIRCPKGCGVQWLGYLYHEDEGPERTNSPTRVCEQVTYDTHVAWHIGLRCGNCGVRYGKKDVTDNVKAALDNLQIHSRKAVKDFAEALDDSKLRQAFRDKLEEGIR